MILAKTDVPTFLYVVGLAFGLATVLGGLVVYFKSSVGRNTTIALQAGNAELRAQAAENRLRISALEAENSALKGLVTGVDAINSLKAQLAQQHTELLKAIGGSSGRQNPI